MPWAGSLVKNTIRPHRVESRILDCFYASWKPAAGVGPQVRMESWWRVVMRRGAVVMCVQEGGVVAARQ